MTDEKAVAQMREGHPGKHPEGFGRCGTCDIIETLETYWKLVRACEVVEHMVYIPPLLGKESTDIAYKAVGEFKDVLAAVRKTA